MAIVEAIQTTYFEAEAASVRFASIPQTYDHLQLRVSARESFSAADRSAFTIRFNSTSTATYGPVFWLGALGSSTSVSAYTDSDTVNELFIQYGQMGGNCPNTVYSSAVIDILDYTNPNKTTSIAYMAGWGGGTSPNPRGAVGMGGGFWEGTDAIDDIEFFGSSYYSLNYARGSVFSLYGFKSA